MSLRIEPTSELTIKLDGKAIGVVEGINVDFSNPSFLSLFPKVVVYIRLNSKELSDKQLEDFKNKATRFKFLRLNVV